jgi:hypothetical protein
MRPNIDELIAKGYLRKGGKVVFHRYNELTHNWKKAKTAAKRPYEVHFFPGMKKIVVLGTSLF